MGQEHSILLAIMIFLIFQNSPKQKNSLYQQIFEISRLNCFIKKTVFMIIQKDNFTVELDHSPTVSLFVL